MLYYRDSTRYFISEQEIGWQALGPTIATTILATVVVGLRWYTRAHLVHCLGKDDYIILVALILSWAYCIVVGVELPYGLGTYTDQDATAAKALAEMFSAHIDLYIIATNVTKASILAQYFRIFINPTIRYLCAFGCFLLFVAGTWSVLWSTLLCLPVQKLWMPDLPGRCMDAWTYFVASSIVNATLDLFVLVLPLPCLMKLRLPPRHKICINSLFLLGFLVFVVSIVRLVTVYLQVKAEDKVRAGTNAIIWSAVEVNTGIICASLVTLKPLIVRLRPGLLEGTNRSELSRRSITQRPPFPPKDMVMARHGSISTHRTCSDPIELC